MKRNTMTTDSRPRKMELLAPAGTVAAFEAAVKSGADAVYIGAPLLNARSLARSFTPAEIAAMVDYAHESGARVYMAANSLMKEDEVPMAVRLLGMVEELGIDAIILQDLGLYALAKKYFPTIRLHASTLMTAHNSLGVRQLAKMGFDRVVLARELTIAEINRISRASRVELEVFVHGAMCFSYSGLCLFSSYLGGKSGLRGKCVQPCRRKYTLEYMGKKKPSQEGYYFSMNDLIGLELLPELRKAGVASIKIEGRMKSVNYVQSVVSAYRLALDAAPGDERGLQEAQTMLQRAMGRKSSTGYFLSSQPTEIITPGHSGNIGLFLGKLENVARNSASMKLKDFVARGDRLRLHQEKSGERVSFSLKSIKCSGKDLVNAGPGQTVVLTVPPGAKPGDSLYLVDVGVSSGESEDGIDVGRFAALVKNMPDRKKTARILNDLKLTQGASAEKNRTHSRQTGRGTGKSRQQKARLLWWMKIDDLRQMQLISDIYPERYVVLLNRKTWAQFSKVQLDKAVATKIVWGLPPVIDERELKFYFSAIGALRKQKFFSWQLGHISQLQFFTGERRPGAGKGRKKTKRSPRVELCADYTCNILNSIASHALREMGVSRQQIAIETDRRNLELWSHDIQDNIQKGMTVFGAPPLFVARAPVDRKIIGKKIVSPKKEVFAVQEEQGKIIVLPDKPFSLLNRIPELMDLGLEYMVTDFCHRHVRREEFNSFLRQLEGKFHPRSLGAFNYQGKLL